MVELEASVDGVPNVVRVLRGHLEPDAPLAGRPPGGQRVVERGGKGVEGGRQARWVQNQTVVLVLRDQRARKAAGVVNVVN